MPLTVGECKGCCTSAVNCPRDQGCSQRLPDAEEAPGHFVGRETDRSWADREDAGDM